jgi:hypothetical protein
MLCFSLVACGGGSSGNGPSYALDGAAVKGPLKDATVNVYRVDYSSVDLKGEHVASGTTRQDGRFLGVTITGSPEGFYLIEVIANAQTIDISTGKPPILSTLTTLISAQDLIGNKPVFATPLTSLVVALSLLEGAGSENDLASSIEDYSAQVAEQFGFGLLDKVNIFSTPPVITAGHTDLSQTLAYRTAIEAVASLIWATAHETGIEIAEIENYLTRDLADGLYDGLADGLSNDSVEVLEGIYEFVTGKNIHKLEIPNTSKSVDVSGATPMMVGEVVQMLIKEAEGLNDTGLIEQYRELPAIVVAPIGPDLDRDGDPDVSDEDIDGDGVNNLFDDLPYDSSESVDSDGDDIGDNADAYPFDARCFELSEGDGSDCYQTIINRAVLNSSFIDSQEHIYLYLNDRGEQRLLKWGIEVQKIVEEIEITITENDAVIYPERVYFHPSHERVYIAYRDDSIRYFELSDTRKIAFLRHISNGIHNLTQAGRYLAVQSDQTLYVVRYDGSIANERYAWNDYSATFAWDDTSERLYQLKDRSSPNDILYQSVSQLNGSAGEQVESPYHGDFIVKGPILLEKEGTEVVLGSGDVYDASSLRYLETRYEDFDFANQSDIGLSTIVNTHDNTSLLFVYNASGAIIYSRSFEFQVEGLFPYQDHYVVLARHGEERQFQAIQPNVDIDGDGVDNLNDAFPLDPAASLDSDNDLWPDSWNPGVDVDQISSALQIDAFPLDSACQLASQSIDGQCDIQSQINIEQMDQVTNHENLFYLLSANQHTVFVWDAQTREYRNPILLTKSDQLGQPLTIGVDSDGSLLVGYNSGALVEVFSELPFESVAVHRFSKGLRHIKPAGEYLIAVVGEGNYDREYYVLDNKYAVVDVYERGEASNDYAFNPQTQRFYWFTNTYSDNIESYALSASGQFTSFKSHRYSSRPTSFMSVSPDGDLIVTGEGGVVRNFENAPHISELNLTSIEGETDTSINLIEHVWFDDISVTAFNLEGQSHLVIWSASAQAYFYHQPFSDGNIIDIVGNDEGVVVVYQAPSGKVGIRSVPLLSDADQDGMPLWWESRFGLNDQHNSDGSQDPDKDGLDNFEEFLSSTSPHVSDTDQDGISDAEEVNVYKTNPTNSDTDADLLPDGWEIEHSLDPDSGLDASIDSDGDGYSNLIEFINGNDPNDPLSVPEALSTTYYSFEDRTLPSDWFLTGETASVAFDQAYASHGSSSMSISGNAGVHWYRVFSPVEIKFDVRSGCYINSDSRLMVYLDGIQIISTNPPQTEWLTLTITLEENYHEIDFQVENHNPDCSLHIDNIQVQRLKTVYEMGASIVSSYDQQLLFIDNSGVLLRSIKIPDNNEYTGYARDIAVLDDGRIAVYNGTFAPYLSIYTPERHQWQNVMAPGWSTVNNGSYGGIDAIGDVVYATNMAVYGSQSMGFVRFDLVEGRTDFVSQDETSDLTVGLDGFLYGTNGRDVWKYDPSDFSLISSVELDDVRGIAVAVNGDIFVASWAGQIKHYSSDGVLLKQLQIGGNFSDISLRTTGDIVIGERFGKLYLTNTELNEYTLIHAPGEFVDHVPDVDSDSDGLPDWWEHANNLNPLEGEDASSDNDNDGLDALSEFRINTRATESDTDQDGVSDGDEYLIYGSNPLDVDSDGDTLTDGDEVDFGTDPTKADTDGDLLHDAEELNEYFTDPLKADSDSDGMPDGYEVAHGLDPLSPDAVGDADNDGLTNLEEANLNTDPNVADTDGDLLSDFEEHTLYSTNPLAADSDADLMPDGWEVLFSLDPLDDADAIVDGDGDQFNNLEEFLASSSPVDQASIPVPVPWHSYQGGASHSGYSPYILDTDDFELRWTVSLPGVDNLHPVTAAEGKVFVTSNSYYGHQGAYSISAANGNVIWEKIYEGIYSIDPPAYLDGKVIFQTGGHGDSFIRGIDATSGELVFATAYDNQWSTYLTPTLFEGDIYTAGGYYGGIYAFDGISGSQKWFTNTPQEDGFTPAVDENHVYAFVNRLYVYDRISGEQLFSIEQERGSGYATRYATLLTSLGNVVVAHQGALTVFDPSAQDVLWELSGSYHGQPAVAANTIYVLDSGILKVLNEQTGELLWTWEAPESLHSNIIVTKNLLFVGGQTTTYAIDLLSHQEVWQYAAKGHLSLSDEGALYIAGSALVAISISGE